MGKRFQRPLYEYTGAEDLKYRDKYQQDSQSVPKIAISSSKVDGDFNYLVDAVNTLDEDIKSVVYSGIATSAIESKHIADGVITEEKIADNSIGSANIKTAAVTGEKIADLSITGTKIANNSITEDKMSDYSVGTSSVIDGAITKDKLASDVIMDSIPVGTIAQFSVDVLPSGWLECNGATISKDTYSKLVRFLTGSDLEISAVLPNVAPVTKEQDGQMMVVVKSAIKAFSDSPELANLEIAGLTQDVAKNSADISQNKKDISNRALKRFEPIAECSVGSQGSIDFGYNIKSVSRLGTGTYKIYLDDSLKGTSFQYSASARFLNVAIVDEKNETEGYVVIQVRKFVTESCIDSPLYIRFFKTEEEVV